jgi:hypothetical protein
MTDTIGEFEKKVRSDQNKYNKKKKFGPQGRAGIGSLPKKEDKKGTDTFIIIGDQKYKVQNMAKGGRAGYRMGGKCKLAKKGKGRAYGKNS